MTGANQICRSAIAVRTAFERVLMALVFTASVAQADSVVLLREAISVGEAETTTDIEVWIGEDTIARVGGAVRIVLDSAGQEVFLVNDAERTVRSVPVVSPERSAPVIDETDEVVEVGGWRARRFDVEIEPLPGETMPVTVWTSEDTTMDRNIYLKYARATDQGLGLADVIEALPGIPILIEIKNGPVESRIEILGIRDANPPSGVYDIPKDYAFQ